VRLAETTGSDRLIILWRRQTVAAPLRFLDDARREANKATPGATPRRQGARDSPARPVVAGHAAGRPAVTAPREIA
jgi:hypothetical protein